MPGVFPVGAAETKGNRRSVRLAAAAALFALWAWAFFPAFKAELRGVALLPQLYPLGYETKAAIAGGPANSFAHEAASVVGPDATLYVLEPDDAALSKMLAGRLNYHLYPARVVRVRKDRLARPGAVPAGGFVAVYMTAQSFDPALERLLVERHSLVPMYSRLDEAGRRAIYRAAGEAAP